MPPRPNLQVPAAEYVDAGRLTLLVALALTCPSAEVAEMADVEVGSMTIAPAGDLRDSEHRFEFHPKALLGGGWDSAVMASSQGNGGDDTWFSGLAGILVRYHPRRGLDASLDAELEQTEWQRNPRLDTDAGLLRARFDYRAPALAWVGDAAWRRSQESLLTTGEQVTQDHYVFHTRIGHMGGFWWEEVTASIGRLDYLQGTASFDDRQGDRITGQAGVRFGLHEGGDRVFVAVNGETVHYSVDERFNDCQALVATAGGIFPASDRSLFRVEAGAEVRRYADDYQHDSVNGDQLALAPWWDLGGVWSWQAGDRLEARLYSDLADSLTSNATWSLGVAVAARRELTPRLAVDAGLDLSEARDAGLNHASPSLQRRIYAASLAGQYAVATGLAARLRADLTRVDPDSGKGYERLELRLELAYVH